MNRAVIFDLDGVIIDSEIYYCSCIRNFLRDEGYLISEEQSWEFAGLSLALGKQKMMEIVGRQSGEAVWKKYFDYIITHPLDYKSLEIPGVRHLLHRLHAENIKIGLASSGRKENVHNALRLLEIDQYFEAVVTGDEVEESKPNPAIYHKAAELLGALARDCIVVEDSTPGIAAGVSAGAYVIAREEKRFNYVQTRANIILEDMNKIENHIFAMIKD